MAVPAGMRCDLHAVTGRRRRIVAARERGLMQKEIARELRLDIRTVQRHLHAHGRGIAPAGRGGRVFRMPGISGKTHCGKWTSSIPDGLWATRLVCTEKPGHQGPHHSRWCDLEWTAGQIPRKQTRT